MPSPGVREDLAGLEPYVSPQRPGWSGLRMNTNESPYPPPATVIEELLVGMRTAAFNRYPDRDAGSLVRALATELGHPAEGLWLANGSNEVFMHLFLAFGGPGRSVMVFEPTYSLHSLIPRIAGTELLSLGRDESFAIDLPSALEAIDEGSPDAIILCSPNNPTGDVEARATVEAILERASGLVIVDEAYGEFAPPETSVRDLLHRHDNLVVVKTFSKAWSLAGARLGYLMAAPQVVKDLARVRLPYHLSTPTQLLGEAVLAHSDEMRDSIDKVIVERDRIVVELQALGIKTYPSRANFVLFELDDAERVWNRLVERGVLIRRYEGTPGLERCLRVTAGLPEETDDFLRAVEDALR
jgi:histidinol-phosphate aminotransferase